MLSCVDPVPLLNPGEMAMVVLDLIMNLVPDQQRSKGEKLAIGLTLSQYPPTICLMAKGHREIHHLLTRTTLRMADIIQTTLLPARRLICHHQSIRRSKFPRVE
jgi:hypothetical protein